VKQMRPGSVSLTLLLTKVALSKQLTV
ncbi:TPA: alanine dehydrogenase, partial [Streptococcus pneumoniae]